MRKAAKLFSILLLWSLLLPPSAFAAPEADADALTPPAGTVYAVSPCALSAGGADKALTVVDLAMDGADETLFGIRYDGGSQYYYGAEISRVTYGALIDGAGTGYFGSSTGTIPLYDSKGAVSGVVWGDCRSTAIADCDSGFLVSGDVEDGIFVEDGASVHSREALILCQEGDVRFRFNNAALQSDSGILLQMDENAGDVAVSYSNGAYCGALVNQSGSVLSVAVEKGALLCGDVSRGPGGAEIAVAAGGTWVVPERSDITRLTVEDGGAVYAKVDQSEQGQLILLPADELLDSGIYTAQPLTEALPFGHGPAMPEEDTETNEPVADDLPLGHGPVLPEEDTEADEPLTDDLPLGHGPALPEEDTEADEPLSDAWRASRLFPLKPREDEPEAESDAVPDEIPLPELPEIELSVRLPDIAPGLLLSCPPARQSLPADAAATLGLLAHIPLRQIGEPPMSSIIKTGAKTHSFLPETIDNQPIILYNPYCCLAA